MTPSQKDHRRKTRLSAESFLPYQFGGTGGEYITQMAKLSTGDIVACGQTTSSTFLGQNASAYFNGGSSALWIGIFDGVTLAKKALIFENGTDAGSTNYFGYAINWAFNSLCVDASDNIYYSFGQYASATSSYVKKRSGTDLSLIATSAAFTTNFSLCSMAYYDGNIYIARDLKPGVDCVVYNAALSSSTTYALNTLDATSCGSESGTPLIKVNSNGVYIFSKYYSSYGFKWFSKWTHALSFQARRDFNSSGKSNIDYHYNNDVLDYDGKFYLTFKSTSGGGFNSTDLRCAAINQSDLTDVSGFTDVRLITVNNVNNASVGSRLIDVKDGNVAIVANIPDPTHGNDAKLVAVWFNPSTGSVVYGGTGDEVQYADGVSVYYPWVSGKNTYIGDVVSIGNRIVAGFQVNYNIRDFSLSGTTDCALLPISIKTFKAYV